MENDRGINSVHYEPLINQRPQGLAPVPISCPPSCRALWGAGVEVQAGEWVDA